MNQINISFQATPKTDLPKGMKNGLSIVVQGRTFAILEGKKEGMATKIENRFEKFKTDLSNINKSEEERNLHINKWIPIATEDGQVLFIKVQELFSKTLLGDEKWMYKTLGKMISQDIEDRVGLSGEAGIVFEGRTDLLEPEMNSIEAQAEIITSFLLFTLHNEESVLDTRPQLHELFNRPLSEQLKESILLKNDLPQINLDEIGNNSDAIRLRAGNSETINKQSAESERALSNWLEADKMVRVWASEKKFLALSEIQDLNRILTLDLKNNEGVPGEFRGNGCNIRPGAGPQYVLGGYVKEEMEKFSHWLNEQMDACDKGVANPVEVAARAAQKLISIHPFSDANGRTGQFVMNLILQRAGLPPATLKNPNFAVFGALSEDNESNVLIDAAVENVKDGINRTCGFVNIESPFINE